MFFSFLSEKLRDSLTIIIACAVPLLVFHLINKHNRIMFYTHKKNKVKYYIMKTLLSILTITIAMHLRDVFNNTIRPRL
jgi:hypothetical protein